MAEITQAPSGFGAPGGPKGEASSEGGGQPWSARTALLFWLAASGLVWLALATFAATVV